MLVWFRIFQFVSMLNVSQRQAALVRHSSTFTLGAEEGSRQSTGLKVTSDNVAALLRDFRPDLSLPDRMVLALITGREKDDCMEAWRGLDDGHDRCEAPDEETNAAGEDPSDLDTDQTSPHGYFRSPRCESILTCLTRD